MLRTRLLLNLLPFIIILMAMAFFSVWLVEQMARETARVPFEKYHVLVSAEIIQYAADGMDHAVQLSVTAPAVARDLFDRYARLAARQLQSAPARNQNQSPTRWQALHSEVNAAQRAGEWFVANPRAPDRAQRYQQEFAPRIQSIRRQASELESNHRLEWHAIQERINLRRQRSTQFMIAAVILVLTCSGYACYLLGRAIFLPINLLTGATREIGKGNLDQVVPIIEQDELGELAQAFNQMAAQLRDYRQNTTHQITRLHRTMETTLASFPDPIFVLSHKSEIELKNPAAEAFSRDLQLEGALPLILHDTMKRVLETGESFLPTSFKDSLFFRINQQERYYLPRVLGMRNTDGLVLGVAIVLLDVTRFRLMDDVKSNLVATVSHELKTPLTSVRMVLHLLLEKVIGPINDKQEELIIAARNDAERLLRILNNLLDLTRFEEGSIDVYFEEVTPDELVQMAVEETRESVLGRGVTLQAEVEPGLPRVRVDRQRIGHVFTNLINNAIKHSPIGERILIRAARAEESGVTFHVIDRGPGIPEQYHTRIFEKFFRVPGQAKKGAGLGLSIAKEIVVAHGGDIGVKSKLGRGSEFYVFLPNGKERP